MKKINIKRAVASAVAAMIVALSMTFGISAATHTVVSGDTLWKIASRYQWVSARELAANAQFANPDLINPGRP